MSTCVTIFHFFIIKFISNMAPGAMEARRNLVIDHIVLLKVRTDATEEEKKKLIDGTLSLKSIPGVLTITIGPTFAEEWMPDRRNGVTHTLSVRLESKEALRLYQDHPLHVRVKNECMGPLLSGPVMAVDYESDVAIGGGNP